MAYGGSGGSGSTYETKDATEDHTWVFSDLQNADVTTATAFWSGVASVKHKLKGFVVSTVVAGWVEIYDNATLIFKFYFDANGGAVCSNFGGATYEQLAVNTNFEVKQENAGNISITGWGYDV